MESKFVEVKCGNVERLRVSVFERDGYACRYCGSKTPPFHLDHVYPVSKGGETTEDNLVTACAICNQKKHDKVGLWPRPIQHFETYKLPELKTSVFLMFFGFLLTMGGKYCLFL